MSEPQRLLGKESAKAVTVGAAGPTSRRAVTSESSLKVSKLEDETMNRALAVLILVAVLGLPSFAQGAGLSADDQREFDSYYKKWVDDTRRNDRDDIASDVRHMQEIMARHNIPSDVPFDRVASTGSEQTYPGAGYARLSAEDQAEFD